LPIGGHTRVNGKQKARNTVFDDTGIPTGDQAAGH
jgi:hypothetical protein